MVVRRSVEVNPCMPSVKETELFDMVDNAASKMFSSTCCCVLATMAESSAQGSASQLLLGNHCCRAHCKGLYIWYMYII